MQAQNDEWRDEQREHDQIARRVGGSVAVGPSRLSTPLGSRSSRAFGVLLLLRSTILHCIYANIPVAMLIYYGSSPL